MKKILENQRKRSSSGPFKIDRLGKKEKSGSSNSKKLHQEVKSSSGSWVVSSTDSLQSPSLQDKECKAEDIKEVSFASEVFYPESDNEYLPEKKEKVEPIFKGNNFSLYHFHGKKILVLKRKADVAVKGVFNIHMVHGQITIYGYTLSPENGSVPVYSPNRMTSISLCYTYARSITYKTYSFLEEFEDPVCVAILTPLEEENLTVIKSCPSFRRLFNFGSLSEFDFFDEDLKLGFIETSDNILKFDDEHIDIIRDIDEANMNGDAPCIAVCGGRDTGKSTLCRYIVNKCLSSTDQVIYVETDVGQTETTGPTCVSISVISSPLLGPPFTHMNIPKLETVFFGHSTPADDPVNYLMALNHLYVKLQKLPQKATTIINTIGWVNGLGELLIMDTLKLFKPSVVIQISSSKPYLNLPALTTEKLNGLESYFKTSVGNLDHELIQIKSPTENIRIDHSLLNKELRDLALISSVFTENRNIFKANFKDIAIKGVGCKVQDGSLVPFLLNAQVIGLCSKPQNVEVIQGDYDLCSIEEDIICSCYGLGIVKSVDIEERIFYVETSVNSDDMANVDLFMVGDTAIPVDILQNQRSTYSKSFYLHNFNPAIGLGSVKDSRKVFQSRNMTNRDVQSVDN